MLFILLIFIAVQEYNKLKKEAGKEAEFYYLLKWNEAAEYDKHRKERYLKFVNMFFIIPMCFKSFLFYYLYFNFHLKLYFFIYIFIYIQIYRGDNP